MKMGVIMMSSSMYKMMIIIIQVIAITGYPAYSNIWEIPLLQSSYAVAWRACDVGCVLQKWCKIIFSYELWPLSAVLCIRHIVIIPE